MKETLSGGPQHSTPAVLKPQAVTGARVLADRLETCWESYRQDLERCRGELAEPQVHDVRVAARRLSVALEMGSFLARKKRGVKLRRLVKTQLNAFDHLRDIQVQLILLEDLPAPLPEIDMFRAYLQRCEQQTAFRLSRKVLEFRTQELANPVLKLRKALLGLDRSADESVLWNLVDRAFASVRQYQAAARVDDALTIHKLRLSFKKFRYRVETVFPLLPAPPENFLDRLQHYQAAMGEIQDAEIGLLLLKAYRARRRANLAGLQAGFEELYHSRAVTFLAGLKGIDRFWRSTAEAAFPWERLKS